MATPLTTWNVKRPVLVALLVGLGGTVLTALGMGASQALEFDAIQTLLTLTAAMALSAVIGVIMMQRSHRPPAEYGFRTPENLHAIQYALPLAIPVAIPLVFGVDAAPSYALAALAMALAVGFNEEIWFRGLMLAPLRKLGEKRATVISGLIFGAFHAANALTGKPSFELLLQVTFAALAGLVLCEVLFITRSLWLPILWHAAYDFASLVTADTALTETTTATTGELIAIAIIDVVLLATAVLWWRQLDDTPASAAVDELAAHA